jgi:HSP20 family protein
MTSEKQKEQSQSKERDQQLQRNEPKAESVRNRQTPISRRDPFTLTGWDPFGWGPVGTDLTMWRDPLGAMQQMIRDLWSESERSQLAWCPAFEVRETDDAYIVRGDVPGVSAEELEVSASGDQLQISGKREQQKEETEGEYRTYERAYGSFVRTFGIPGEVDDDHIHSKLDNGVLEVVLPKKPGAKASRRRIEVKSGRGEAH